jgi:predicted type IV restriction endonuclease
MYKVPVRHKRSISQELKKFVPLVNSLQARGKSASEEDARILLNDILHYVLGYDKYNELKTEMRDRNGRIDYVVKLNEGHNKNKNDRFDFVIEAKAAHIELNQSCIDQTLTYCLTMGIDYFILTNAVKWELYRVKRQGKTPTAIRLHDINLGTSNDFDALAEEFYLFSKASYLNDDWKEVTDVIKATKVEDIVAVILSDKIIRTITRELSVFHDVKISEDTVRDIIENQVVKSAVDCVNKRMIKKLNEKPERSKKDNHSNDEEYHEVIVDTELTDCGPMQPIKGDKEEAS